MASLNSLPTEILDMIVEELKESHDQCTYDPSFFNLAYVDSRFCVFVVDVFNNTESRDGSKVPKETELQAYYNAEAACVEHAIRRNINEQELLALNCGRSIWRTLDEWIIMKDFQRYEVTHRQVKGALEKWFRFLSRLRRSNATSYTLWRICCANYSESLKLIVDTERPSTVPEFGSLTKILDGSD